jgi:hypothetical protein
MCRLRHINDPALSSLKMEGIRLLFLYSASYSKWYVHEEKKSTLVYLNIPSAIWPVPHDDRLPVPETPDSFAVYSDDEDSVSSNSEEQQPSPSRDADYFQSTDCNHKITEGGLNDLIRDLELPKK